MKIELSNTIIIPALAAVLMVCGGAFLYLHPIQMVIGASIKDTSDTRIIHHVALTSSGAQPTDLLIKVGEYVEFDSKDGRIHDIASGVGDGDGENHAHSTTGIESGNFKPDEGYMVQFKAVGSYYFHDHLNPTVTISIAVYEPNASSTIH